MAISSVGEYMSGRSLILVRTAGGMLSCISARKFYTVLLLVPAIFDNFRYPHKK